MGNNLYKKILSVSDYDETHIIVYLFGIKMKFLKLELLKKMNKNPFAYYKKNHTDITTIPPATGQIRDIQLANFALLKEFDYVCKQNNLTYWLDFGTLLGAIRHKGFIPWDDDIDLGMLRDDYNKLIDAFNNTSRDSNIYVSFESDKKNNIILKVKHKKCPLLFVDIFPYDLCPVLKEDKQVEITNKMKETDRDQLAGINSFEELSKKIQECRDRLYCVNNPDETGIVYGIDYAHSYKNWFFSKDMAFPLSEMEFENQKFPVFNQYKTYLEKIFGDYMAYPRKFKAGHSMYLTLSDDDKKIIDELKNK